MMIDKPLTIRQVLMANLQWQNHTEQELFLRLYFLQELLNVDWGLQLAKGEFYSPAIALELKALQSEGCIKKIEGVYQIASWFGLGEVPLAIAESIYRIQRICRQKEPLECILAAQADYCLKYSSSSNFLSPLEEEAKRKIWNQVKGVSK